MVTVFYYFCVVRLSSLEVLGVADVIGIDVEEPAVQFVLAIPE